MLAALVMSDAQQLLIELINRARANPTAEATRYEIDLNDDLEPDEFISDEPKQPLSPHQALNQAAIAHALDMLEREFFEHDNPDGESPSDRARAAGYPSSAGENIAWYGTPGALKRSIEVYERHEALFLSPSHRTNLMSSSWREVGVGIEYGEFDSLNSIMVAESFGNRGGDHFITGVAYTDLIVPDYFYTAGESISGVVITATRVANGEQFTTTTSSSGGYTLQVPTGVYSVTATGSSRLGNRQVNNVAVFNANTKVDFNARDQRLSSISGFVFEDRNESGTYDLGEPRLAGRSVFIEVDDNGEHNPDELLVTTDVHGEFKFDHLRAGQYEVRQVPEIGWRETRPTVGQFEIDLAAGHDRSGLDFGTYQFNQRPFANDDAAVTESGVSVSIDVFANDGDPDGALDYGETQMFVSPQHGVVALDPGSNQLIYTPDADFVGTDTFSYAVVDKTGLASEPVTVTVEVRPGTGGVWQNQANRLDVNNDSHVSSIDAMLVLNSITIDGIRRLHFPTAEQSPPPFYDVNGDFFVSPLDALLVLNEINRIAAERRRAQLQGEGEVAPAYSSSQSVLAAVLEELESDDEWQHRRSFAN